MLFADCDDAVYMSFDVLNVYTPVLSPMGVQLDCRSESSGELKI
jgi:hypothetical protein